jgi:hypothetical protein
MALTLRKDLNRPLSIEEMDDNFETLNSSSLDSISNPQEGDSLIYQSGSWVAGTSEEYTETIVNISSTETTYSDGRPLVASGILAMGDTPIELLPDPGVGNYYDVDKVVIENVVGGLQYQLNNDNFLQLQINGNNAYFSPAVLFEPHQTFVVWTGESYRIIDLTGDGDIVTIMSEQNVFGNPMQLSTLTGNATDGTNGLRVKIYHKTITFGA